MKFKKIIKKVSLRRGLCYLGSVACVFFAFGCVTAEKKIHPLGSHGRKVRYELTHLKPVVHQDPLPTRTDISVTWFYEDGFVETYLGFRAWDFNDDGYFELVEEIDPSGRILRRVFDFNTDGSVDKIIPGSDSLNTTDVD